MTEKPKLPEDRIVNEPGSPEDVRQQTEDATVRLVEVGLGGEGTYPWGSPYSKE